jgi:thiol-disulfide isomerase/thioredoxin
VHFLSRPLAVALLAAGSLAGAQEIPKTYGQPPVPRVVAYVELSLKNGDLASAQALAAQYRRLNGDTPEALEALGWVARGELAAGQFDQALKDAEEIKRSSQAALSTRRLDAEPQLPLALGTAYEVEAESLFAQHKRADALQLLQKALRTWRGTSLADRLQKNINEMTLEGRPMPLLREPAWIGAKPVPIAALHGKVLLLFFWAHWCADCKAEAPVIARLVTDLEPKGLRVVAPTRLYGYTAADDHAAPAEETAFIAKVFERYYSNIPKPQIPLDTSNFQRFGVSTTPTIVVVDRRGVVKLYHPGVMDEASLRAVIEPLLSEGPKETATR